MIERPSQFELDILHAILDEQRQKYPALYEQIPFLIVRSRELTGVGEYYPGVQVGHESTAGTSWA